MPMQMFIALEVNRGKHVAKAKEYADKWQSYLEATSWPKTKKEFKAYLVDLHLNLGTLKPTSMMKYLTRKSIVAFDTTVNQWKLTRCVPNESAQISQGGP